MKLTPLVSIFISLFVINQIFAQTIYVAPNGLQSNSGLTIEAPTNLENAFLKLENAQANTIFFRGGEYMIAQRINLNRLESPSSVLRVYAFENENPVFNAENIPITSDAECIRIKGNYYHIKGIEIKNSYSFGIRIQGNYNIVENCKAHHNGGTGIGISLSHCSENPDGLLAAYNLIKNCDSYMNFSWYSSLIGGNSDGFAASLRVGKGNKFVGCRAWINSDDGWDLFKSLYDVEIDSCWTWGNGKMADFLTMFTEKTGNTLTESNFRGDGNGFKMGGNGDGGVSCYFESRGLKTLKNSVAFDNQVVGITQNNHKDGVLIENCVSFNNLRNIRFYLAGNDGTVFTFNNNVIFGTGTSESGITNVNAVLNGNSWQVGQPVYSADDFVTVSVTDAIAPREIDGSLPKNNFAVLKKQLSAINQLKTANDFFCFSQNRLFFPKELCGTFQFFNATGTLIMQLIVEKTISSIDLSDLNSGLFLIRFSNDNKTFGGKFLKY